ncbi:MAG TPA: hypothetical protein VFU14_01250 [Acidimicrobiales bacterium]|nr:hypothetical protein [Acidimicrobiales bacterium]
MHPFQTEMLVHTEIHNRRREAEQRRLHAVASAPWSARLGAVLLAAGRRFDAAGQRLQGMSRAEAPCIQPCS